MRRSWVVARMRGPAARPDMVVRERWSVLAAPVVVLFVVVGAASYLAAMAPDRDGRNWPRIAVFVLAVGLIGRWSAVPWLRWLSDRYIVSGGRLVEQSGVWTQEGRAIALARVADVRVVQPSFIERVFGMGDLAVVPDDGREPLVLVGMPQVKRVQARLLRLVDLARDAAYHAARQSAPQPAARPPHPPASGRAESADEAFVRKTIRIDRPPGTLAAEPRGDAEGPVG